MKGWVSYCINTSWTTKKADWNVYVNLCKQVRKWKKLACRRESRIIRGGYDKLQSFYGACFAKVKAFIDVPGYKEKGLVQETVTCPYFSEAVACDRHSCAMVEKQAEYVRALWNIEDLKNRRKVFWKNRMAVYAK